MNNKKYFDPVYCYPNSNVLKNKLNIYNSAQLHDRERRISSVRIHELQAIPLPGKFDAAHLKAIHKHLFQDMYEWAGQFRTIDIAKGNMFCLVQHIDIYLNDSIKKLHNEELLVNTPHDYFVERLGVYYGDINAAHPFRDGNGRTQRVFIESLARVAGYNVDFSKTTEDQLLEASINSFNGDNTDLNKMFKQIITPISKEAQLSYAKQVLPITHPVLKVISKQIHETQKIKTSLTDRLTIANDKAATHNAKNKLNTKQTNRFARNQDER